MSTEKELPTLGMERGRSRFPEGVTPKMGFRGSGGVHQVQREWKACLLDEVRGEIEKEKRRGGGEEKERLKILTEL